MSKSAKKKSSNNNKEKRQQIKLFSSMKMELQKFKSKREETFSILQEMCNLQNKASFVSPRNLSASLGYATEPNRFAILFDDQFFEFKKDVELSSCETTAALNSFANLLDVSNKDLIAKSVVDNESFVPVEDFILSRLLNDMQQQHALESQVLCIVISIHMMSLLISIHLRIFTYSTHTYRILNKMVIYYF